MAASLRTSYIPKSDVWTMPNMSLRGTTELTFFYARAVPARTIGYSSIQFVDRRAERETSLRWFPVSTFPRRLTALKRP